MFVLFGLLFFFSSFFWSVLFFFFFFFLVGTSTVISFFASIHSMFRLNCVIVFVNRKTFIVFWDAKWHFSSGYLF